MKKNLILAALGTLLLAGCAGNTTDPSKGGLFSYDPSAYKQRISQQQNDLNVIQNDTAVQQDKNRQLKNNYYSQKKKLKSVK